MIKFNNKWIPVSESRFNYDADFDKRFPIDRIFNIDVLFYKCRIRFVQYPSCNEDEVNIFITTLYKPFFKLFTRYPFSTHTVKMIDVVKISKVKEKYGIDLSINYQTFVLKRNRKNKLKKIYEKI